MTASAAEHIILDFGEDADGKLLRNLSGAALGGDHLWTVSDEGRTVECFRRDGPGFSFHRRFRLDALIADLPGGDKDKELDLESVDIAGNRLWLCGSHCRVRRQSDDPYLLDPRLRARPSRQLLAALPVGGTGGNLRAGQALPATGKGSLRHRLSANPFLQPFLELPSKENGFDIEGLALWGKAVLLGLRGPLIDSFAVVVEIELDERFRIRREALHFLDLGGLGVRDLAAGEDHVIVLAGPVGDATAPFCIHRWQPQATPRVQRAETILEFPAGQEKPEALCRLQHRGRPGMLVLYDSPAGWRISGNRYRADWLPVG